MRFPAILSNNRLFRLLWWCVTLPLEAVRGIFLAFCSFGERWGGYLSVGISVLSTFPQSPFYEPYGTGAVVSGYIMLPLWAFCRWILPAFTVGKGAWWRLPARHARIKQRAPRPLETVQTVKRGQGQSLTRTKMTKRLSPELQALVQGGD
jgi:hypothetical protein